MEGENWLKDVTIDDWIEKISTEIPKDTWVIHSQAITSIFRKQNQYKKKEMYEQFVYKKMDRYVKKIKKKKPIITKIITPILRKKHHTTVIIEIIDDCATIMYHDSLFHKKKLPDDLEIIYEALLHQFGIDMKNVQVFALTELNMHSIPYPKQLDGNNCGIFTIACISRYIFGIKSIEHAYKNKENKFSPVLMRQYLKEMLKKNKNKVT